MSGAYAIKTNPEKTTIYDLLEDEEQRAVRAWNLRLQYAKIDPDGWDARRLRAREEEVA
jgi:hypothetical protein